MTKATKTENADDKTKAHLSDRELNSIVGGIQVRSAAASRSAEVTKWDVSSVTSM